MFGNNGFNIMKTPYKRNSGPVRVNSSNMNKSLQDENRSLRAEIAKKDQMIIDYRRQIEELQKRVNELSRNNRNSNNYQSNNNNFHYQRSSSQSHPNERRSYNRGGTNVNRMLYGDFDEFTDAFFNEPMMFFNDPFFGSGNRNRISQNRAPRQNYNQSDYYQPQNTDIEADIIDQLYPNPDNMTYEQLLALEEQVGSVSKGLSKADINKIPTVKFSKYLHKDCDKCAICQFEYKNYEQLRKYKCGHLFHVECSDEWLKSNKTCPICKMEVK